MMNACHRIDDVESNVSRGISQASQRLRSEMNDQINRIHRRHDRFENALSGMSSEMRRMESGFNRSLRNLSVEFQNNLLKLDDRLTHRIQQQGRELRSEIRQHRHEIDQHLHAQRQEYTQMFEIVSDELQDLRGDLSRFKDATNQRFDQQRREYFQLIQDMGEQFADALAEQRYELQNQINDIHRALAEEKQDKRYRAEQWANDTQQLLNAIDSAYRHEKFQPGALAKLQNELILIHGNIQNGDYEAAISASQQTYLRAKTLQMVLEQLEMEWNTSLNAARLSAAELIALCDAQQLAEFAIDTEEGVQNVKAEIDFWTNGRLSEVRRHAEDEQRRLEHSEDMSLDDLRKSIAKTQQTKQIVELLAEQAKEALIASQLRNNIGQTIEQALLDAGWEITDSAYEGEDFRGAIHVKLQNYAKDELVTIITPEYTSEQTIRNRVNISFFDRSSNDENNRLQRLRNITQLLRENGLECSPPACTPGTENKPCTDETKLNLDAVRKQKPRITANERMNR